MTQAEKKKWKNVKIKALLDPALFQAELPLIIFKTVEVKEKKKISPILALLNRLAPLPKSMSHLKRVNGSTKESRRIILTSEEVTEELHGGLEEILGTEFLLGEAEIPSEAPKTKAQYLWALKHWPLSFREDKELETLLTDEIFDTVNKERVIAAMERVTSKSENNVLFTDGEREIMASGTSSHPLQHAIMVGIRELAEKSSAEVGYLASGMDCFVRLEPCAMCAMALLHSRIKRVFFAIQNPTTGALQSKMALHRDPNLNHKFQAFHVSSDNDNVLYLGNCR